MPLAFHLNESLDLFQAAPIAFSLLSLVVSGLSFWTAQTALRCSLYRDIDGLYMGFLKEGIANPQFVDPSRTAEYKKYFKGDERIKYELFAFCAWNICETIFDHRKDKSLFETWEPAIVNESSLHRAWFDHPQNRKKFKRSFCAFVEEKYPTIAVRADQGSL